VIGSYIFAVALYHLWRERREIAASFDPDAGPGDCDDAAAATPQPLGASV